MLLILDYYIQTFALKVQASSHGNLIHAIWNVFVGRSLFFCRLWLHARAKSPLPCQQLAPMHHHWNKTALALTMLVPVCKVLTVPDAENMIFSRLKAGCFVSGGQSVIEVVKVADEFAAQTVSSRGVQLHGFELPNTLYANCGDGTCGQAA